jgi:hypothetical protein
MHYGGNMKSCRSGLERLRSFNPLFRSGLHSTRTPQTGPEATGVSVISDCEGTKEHRRYCTMV